MLLPTRCLRLRAFSGDQQRNPSAHTKMRNWAVSEMLFRHTLRQCKPDAALPSGHAWGKRRLEALVPVSGRFLTQKRKAAAFSRPGCAQQQLRRYHHFTATRRPAEPVSPSFRQASVQSLARAACFTFRQSRKGCILFLSRRAAFSDAYCRIPTWPVLRPHPQ